MQKENPGCKIEVSVFDDNIDNMREIKAALEEAPSVQDLAAEPNQRFLSNIEFDNNDDNLIEDIRLDSERFEKDETILSSPSQPTSTLPTFYLITATPPNAAKFQHHCYKLTNEDFTQSKSNPYYFQDQQENYQKQEYYQELRIKQKMN